MIFSRLIGTTTATVVGFGIAASALAQPPAKTLPAAQAPAPAPSKQLPLPMETPPTATAPASAPAPAPAPQTAPPVPSKVLPVPGKTLPAAQSAPSLPSKVIPPSSGPASATTTPPAPTAPPAPRAPLPVELLVNGSFEEGPAVNDFLALDPGSTAIVGWKVTRGQIDYIENHHWKAADGERSLDLHGSPGYGGVEQTFQTTKGQRYRVTFSLAGSPGCEFQSKSVAVSAAGKAQAFSFDSTGKTIENMGWVTNEWEFDAVADQTTLEIFTLEKTDPVAGPALDNVRVEAVPARK